MTKMCAMLGCAAILVGGSAGRAVAMEPFFKEFMAKYVTESGNAALIATATTTKCGICHSDPKNKKVRNAYGKQVARLLKKTDVKNTKKIQDALDTVGAMKSDPNNNDSPTWAELFASGKLP